MSLSNGGTLLAQRYRSPPAEPTSSTSVCPTEHSETTTSRVQSQRRKSWRPKVRSSGCSECKANHHTCDAQRPVCSRCVRLGRLCAYVASSVDKCSAGELQEYSGAYSLSHRRQMAETLAFNSFSKASTTFVDSKYGIYFDHFRYHVASQLGGDAFGNFWQQCVLREGARDQCILDAILALGGLDRARKCDPLAAATPLFAALPSLAASSRRGAQVDHYPQAVSLYAKALNDYRCRVTAGTVSPRTTLIMTLLLVTFEHFHGNMDAVDSLTSRTHALLKKEFGVLIRDSPGSDHTPGTSYELAPFVAANLDDDGVRVAANLLERMVSLNALYTPLYPRCNAMIKDSLDVPKFQQAQPIMQPLDAHSGILEIQTAWTSFLTMVGAWIQKANRAGIKCYTEKSPVDEELLVEQSHYKHQLKNLMSLIDNIWQDASKASQGDDHGQQRQSRQEDEKPYSEMDSTSRLVLERIQLAVTIANVSVSSALDATAQTWDSLDSDLHDVLDRISGVLDASTPEARESGVLYDDMLGLAAHVAAECRNWEVRRKAMARWSRMLSPRSSWENKTCFMGITALVLTEEAVRPSADQSEMRENGADGQDSTRSGRSEESDKRGIIPVEAQCKWTRGVWDKDFAQYTVTLTPKLEAGLQNVNGLLAPSSGEINVVLDLQDFPFGRIGSGGLDAVERLQQYLSR